ncbi:MAG: sporulation protein YqfD [Clostridia bacterium]|nr:sporulation protein YqfD [Clostridia bacterium]
MINGLYSKTRICISIKEKSRVLDLIITNNLTYIKLLFDNEKFFIEIYTKYLKQYKEILKTNTIDAHFSEPYGLLAKIYKIKNRCGLIIGIVFILLTIYISSNIVWKINIDGNSKIKNEVIVKELESAGLTLGSFIPGINYDELHNRFLLNSKNIAWISVNIEGNTANVHVREILNEEPIKENTYTNVISKYDGQIVSISIKNGKKVINVGDVVKKGDLLISGVLESQSMGIRYVHAEGEIKAYVNKQIFIKIPYETLKKSYTGKVYTENSYKIFSNIINFSLKYRNSGVLYDKIIKEEDINLFGVNNLPFKRITTKFYEYEMQRVKYTKDEVVDLAFLELRKQMDIQLCGTELISKKINSYFDENYFYIDCSLYCLEDIAQGIEIIVE